MASSTEPIHAASPVSSTLIGEPCSPNEDEACTQPTNQDTILTEGPATDRVKRKFALKSTPKVNKYLFQPYDYCSSCKYDASISIYTNESNEMHFGRGQTVIEMDAECSTAVAKELLRLMRTNKKLEFIQNDADRLNASLLLCFTCL